MSESESARERERGWESKRGRWTDEKETQIKGRSLSNSQIAKSHTEGLFVSSHARLSERALRGLVRGQWPQPSGDNLKKNAHLGQGKGRDP